MMILRFAMMYLPFLTNWFRIGTGSRSARQGAADVITHQADGQGTEDAHDQAVDIDLLAVAPLVAVEHGDTGEGGGHEVGAGASHGGAQGYARGVDGPVAGQGHRHAHSGHHRNGGHVGGEVGGFRWFESN